MIVRVIVRIAMVLFGLALPLVVAEIALRIIDKPSGERSGWKIIYPDKLEENQLGFRGQPIEYSDDDFVIVMLGDSQVEAVACSFEWMPERRLEHHLSAATGKKIRVFTVGAGAYGHDQELLALREYFQKYRANMVVLWQTPNNDIWNNIFPTGYPADGWPKPTYWLENGELKGPTELPGEQLMETPKTKLLILLQRWFKPSRDKQWEKRLPPPYAPMQQPDGPVKDDWQRLWDTNSRGMKSENLATEKSHLSIFLTPRSERMEYGLNLGRKLQTEIQELTRSHGGDLTIFASDTNSKDAIENEGTHVLNGKYYKTSSSQFTENLKTLNQGFNFTLIPVTVTPWKVGPENPHLNEHATDQVMKDLAEQLKVSMSNQGNAGQE